MKIYSRGGVPVCTDYRENFIVDKDNPILKWKAEKEKFSPSLFPQDVRAKYPKGLSRIGSCHSEDALSWNVFRTLELVKKISLVADLVTKGANISRVYFWGRLAQRGCPQIDCDIQEVLNEIEPWGWDGVKQQTEPDIILRGNHLIIIECKLGKPGEKIKAWKRSTESMRKEYREFLASFECSLFNDTFDFEIDGNRCYQLFRNYLLGAVLSLKWGIDYSLVAIVNDRNSNLDGNSHESEFEFFQRKLNKPSNTFLITWQQIRLLVERASNLEELKQYLEGHTLI